MKTIVEIEKVARDRYSVYVNEDGKMSYYPCQHYSLNNNGNLILDKEKVIRFDEINIKNVK